MKKALPITFPEIVYRAWLTMKTVQQLRNKQEDDEGQQFQNTQQVADIAR